MRRRLIAVPVLALAGLSAICITLSSTAAFHQDPAEVSAAATCETKNCPPNTHCCYGCSGSPICVKNYVRCPECAPQ